MAVHITPKQSYAKTVLFKANAGQARIIPQRNFAQATQFILNVEVVRMTLKQSYAKTMLFKANAGQAGITPQRNSAQIVWFILNAEVVRMILQSNDVRTVLFKLHVLLPTTTVAREVATVLVLFLLVQIPIQPASSQLVLVTKMPIYLVPLIVVPWCHVQATAMPIAPVFVNNEAWFSDAEKKFAPTTAQNLQNLVFPKDFGKANKNGKTIGDVL